MSKAIIAGRFGLTHGAAGQLIITNNRTGEQREVTGRTQQAIERAMSAGTNKSTVAGMVGTAFAGGKGR